MAPAALQSLSSELVTSICARLDPVSLAQATCTNREMRAIGSTPALWQTLSSSRWKCHNAPDSQHTQGDSEQDPAEAASSGKICDRLAQTDYRRLYATNNGWKNGQVKATVDLGSYSVAKRPDLYGFCVSRAAAAEHRHTTDPAGDVVYSTHAYSVDLWSTGDRKRPGQLLQTIPLNERLPVQGITELATGLLAAGVGHGAGHGSICVLDFRPECTTDPYSSHWTSGSRYGHTCASLLAAPHLTVALCHVSYECNLVTSHARPLCAHQLLVCRAGQPFATHTKEAALPSCFREFFSHFPGLSHAVWCSAVLPRQCRPAPTSLP